MPTSSSPPSPPAPANSAAATPRRRRRLLSSTSTTTSSTSSSPFSFFPPSPSPFHRFLPSPLRASSVPFSWEHRPGIPKTPARSRSSKAAAGKAPLPLPPSLLISRATDPYASSVVPAEYAAMTSEQRGRAGWRLGRIRVPRRGRGSSRRSRLLPRPRVADGLAEWLSMLSLYRSCKRAASCLAAKLKSA